MQTVTRVYHFILDPRIGGPHIYVDSLRRMITDRIESFIITSGKGALTDIALFNIRHYWKLLYVIEVPINVVLICFFIVTGRIKLGNTVFNVHGAANLAPLIAARILKVPVIWHFHETVVEFKLIVNLGKAIIKNLQYRIVVVANKAKEIYLLDNAEVIPCPIDSVYWSHGVVDKQNEQLALWSNYSGGERTLRIVTVGNLNSLKGLDILLSSLSNIEIPWHLKIVGSELDTFRDYARSLHKQVHNIIAGNRGRTVEFMGWQDKSHVRLLLQTCDLFILPSRSEACPISLLEAMSMECICVATDVGDVREILSIGGDDYNIVNPDAAHVRKGILEVIAMPSDKKRLMTLKNRKKIEESYSVEKIANRYLDIVGSLIS